MKVQHFQTNLEGEMCERIHQAHVDNVDAVIHQRWRLDALQLRHSRRAGHFEVPYR